MLEIKNMSFAYNDNQIYDNVSLILEKNGIYYLDAPNGTGKSTLFKILKKELDIDGDITVNGINTFNKFITYIDYNNVIEHRLTVIDQISLFTNDENYINELLTKFKLYNLKDHKIKKLSDGERARFCFLLGVLENSPIILLDEAFSHLDEENMDIITDFIYSIAHDRIIIYTSHKDIKVIKYNYRIEIKDKKLLLKEEEFDNDNVKIELKKPVYSNKILRKTIEYNNRYLFLFVLSILIVLSTLFANLIGLSTYSVDKAFIEKSYNIPYVINRYNNFLISQNMEVPYFENINKGEYIVKTKNINKDYIFNIYNINKDHKKNSRDYDFSFDVDNVYVINKFHDIKLLDDEIVITDFLYINLKAMEQIDGRFFDKINDDLYLNFNDRRIKVKYIIDTGYEQLLRSYYNKNFDTINGLIYNDEEYIINRNYYYKSLYMNERTFEKLINDKINLYFNYNIYNINDDKYYYKKMIFDVKDNYKEQLLDGSLPTNENEILLNYKLLNMEFDGEYDLYTSIYFTKDLVTKDNSFDYISKTLRKKYKVSGIIGGTTDIVFFNDNSKFNYYKSDESYYKSNILLNLNEDELSTVLSDKYSFCVDNYTKYSYVKIQNDKMRFLYLAIFLFVIGLSALSIFIYHNLEKKYYLNDLNVLYSKNIDDNLLKKVKNNFFIKNIIFTIFLVVIMLFLLYYFNILNLFINLLYGLKDYKFI